MLGYLYNLVMTVAEDYLRQPADPNVESVEAQIFNHIQANGGKAVFLERRSRGWKGMTYHISYRDVNGIYQQTVCTVEKAHSYHELYWSVDPATILDERVPATKEQIITDLTAENEALRIRLAKLQEESGSIK